jgi:hypothetical protein
MKELSTTGGGSSDPHTRKRSGKQKLCGYTVRSIECRSGRLAGHLLFRGFP